MWVVATVRREGDYYIRNFDFHWVTGMEKVEVPQKCG